MKYKPDWEQAKQRMTALWQGRGLDSPCVGIVAPSGNEAPPAAPASPQQKWADPQWVVRRAVAEIEGTWWGGEATPSSLLMLGWVCCLGGRPRLEMNTIWFERLEVDFASPPPFRFDPQDPWVRRFQACYLAMASAAGRNDFMVGQPCILPACDLLSMLMGTEQFLTALVDHPQWMAQAIRQGAAAQADAREYFAGLLRPRHEFWYGIAGWMPFWAPQPFLGTQSDVSCMLSPGMFDEFILPELDLYARRFGALWYHLDGGDARQHLPRLLSLPYLRVVQYTTAPSEPPNGPSHFPMYRQIQAAGKIVHIRLPKQNVLETAKAMDPNRLMLFAHCSSVAEGQSLLDELAL